jgi:hypothetical protein
MNLSLQLWAVLVEEDIFKRTFQQDGRNPGNRYSQEEVRGE